VTRYIQIINNGQSGQPERMTTMQTWWKIQAYNSTPYWGYGSQEDAEKFADHCDKGREINLHTISEVTDAEMIESLEAGGEGFNLDDWRIDNDA